MKTTDIWSTIRDFYRADSPEAVKSLNAGASEYDITKTEKELGIAFSDEFRQSYRQVNGFAEETYLHFKLNSLNDGAFFWLFWLDKTIETRAYLTDDCSPVHILCKEDGDTEVGWNPKWIPFAQNELGDYICISFDEAAKDYFSYGEIFEYVYDQNSIEYRSFNRLCLPKKLICQWPLFPVSMNLSKASIPREC
jgi:cell wall assembly regulator SMI1